MARAAESVGFASDQPPRGQLGQFQIVKKEVQKLLTRPNEPEFILSFARTRLATGALPGPTGRTGNHVAFYIFSIPGKDMLTIASRAVQPHSRPLHTISDASHLPLQIFILTSTIFF